MGKKTLEADLNVRGTISEYGISLKDTYLTKVAYNNPSSSVGAPFSLQSFIGSTRAMRLFGLPADQIIVEQSTDGGQTWQSAEASDWTKQHLFLQTRSASIKIPLKNGKKSCDCMLRVTITGMKYNVPANTPETEKYNYWNQNYATSNERYCSLSFGYIWLNANYDRIYIEHQHATGAYPDSWNKDGVLNEALGWTGGNCVAFEDSGTFGGDVTQVYNKWNHRFIFRTQAKDGSFNDDKLDAEGLTTQQSIIEISAYGENCWQSANEMMKTDRPYYVNEAGAVVFDQSTMYVNGIVSASNYVHGVNGVYSDSSVYATRGFVFRGQTDADKKLLTADGWWKHIDTFATAEDLKDVKNTIDQKTSIRDASKPGFVVGNEFEQGFVIDKTFSDGIVPSSTYIFRAEGMAESVASGITFYFTLALREDGFQYMIFEGDINKDGYGQSGLDSVTLGYWYDDYNSEPYVGPPLSYIELIEINQSSGSGLLGFDLEPLSLQEALDQKADKQKVEIINDYYDAPTVSRSLNVGVINKTADNATTTRLELVLDNTDGIYNNQQIQLKDIGHFYQNTENTNTIFDVTVKGRPIINSSLLIDLILKYPTPAGKYAAIDICPCAPVTIIGQAVDSSNNKTTQVDIWNPSQTHAMYKHEVGNNDRYTINIWFGKELITTRISGTYEGGVWMSE